MTGLASGKSMWSLSAKSFKAPDTLEQVRKAEARELRESEKRKIRAINIETRQLAENREVAAMALRADDRARRAAMGLGTGLLATPGLGALRRSNSFSGLSGAYGLAERERQLEREVERERERSRSRVRLGEIERREEALHRLQHQRSASHGMIHGVTPVLRPISPIMAVRSVSPVHRAVSPVGIIRSRPSSPGGHLTSFVGATPRPRANSFHHTPSYPSTPHPVGHAPPGILKSVSIPRSPSPHATPVVNNYYNISSPAPARPITMQHGGLSPRFHPQTLPSPYQSPYNQPTPYFPPQMFPSYAPHAVHPTVPPVHTAAAGVFHHPPTPGPFHSARQPVYVGTPIPAANGFRAAGASPVIHDDVPLFGHGARHSPHHAAAHEQEFYVTDNDFAEDGRAVYQVVASDLEGFASAAGYGGASDEAATSMAVQNLIANARSMGANGILRLETDYVSDEVTGAPIDTIARGTAVVLG